jgi:hypothetical protein
MTVLRQLVLDVLDALWLPAEAGQVEALDAGRVTRCRPE